MRGMRACAPKKRTWTITMRFLHATGNGRRLTRRLCRQLFPRRFSARTLTRRLFRACHGGGVEDANWRCLGELKRQPKYVHTNLRHRLIFVCAGIHTYTKTALGPPYFPRSTCSPLTHAYRGADVRIVGSLTAVFEPYALVSMALQLVVDRQ